MNKFIFFLVLTSLSINMLAQIGIQTNTPDASAALDIVATDKGLLIPRVTLTSNLNSSSPVTSPAIGLLVFNISAANQPIGLYFWDGSSWNLFNAGAIATGYWNLTGNTGTTVGTNFIGTTDAEDFAVYTDDTERMRFTSGGQGLVGLTTPKYSVDFVTIEGNATQTWALNAYGDTCAVYSEGGKFGVYAIGGKYGVYGNGGVYGLLSYSNASSGFSVYGKNLASDSYGGIFAGSNLPAYTLSTREAGVSAQGEDGIFAFGQASNGIGIIAGGGTLSTFSTISTGTGGAFTGYHGLYGSASDNAGIGVIGVGNNKGTYHTMPVGSGGAFSGYHGVYAYADTANGTGVIGMGNQYTGGVYLTGNGSGGAFVGNDGSISTAISNNGTGVIGVGNNVLTPYTLGVGSGGAFTGDECGVYGYATNTNGDRYGGYFAAGGNSSQTGYAYVGGRVGNTRTKIIGLGTVNTIVKNTVGELIALTCPEAPEMVFQDFGIGQLINGRTHIELDPDLTININVSDNHPLKVYITPEGDCNGVYVTNKTSTGFDVIELMGGKSNIPFSWQIVATRANEEYILDDGTIEVSDYSHRFPPAPGPLEKIDEDLRNKTVHKQKTASQNAVDVKASEIKQTMPESNLKERK